MFLDDHLIEKTENVTRRINPPQKHPEPVLVGDEPWEGDRLYLYGTPLFDKDEGVFKLWYYSAGSVAYATSQDGIEWEKPELDVAARAGRKTNLVIERPGTGEGPATFPHFYEVFSVLKDDHDPDPNRRYKATFLSIDRDYTGEFEDPYHRGQRRGLGVGVSPDGIHWSVENEWASHEIVDGMSCVLWDHLANRYLCYGRTKLTPEKLDDRWALHGWGRAVNRIESADCRTWSKGELVMAADAQDPAGTEIYSLAVFPYGDVYVGLVQMLYGKRDQGNLDIQLAVSRDSKSFTRVEPRVPFIPEGGVGSWDRFNISVGMPPVEVGDELWFYYSGRTSRHSPYTGPDTGPGVGRIGLAKIKRGRFVSLEASFDGGTVLTKPLRLEGKQLTLNANAAYGSIEVHVLNDRDEPIPNCQATVSGADAVAVPVAFETGALAKLAAQPVRLQLRLANAQLYGFQME